MRLQNISSIAQGNQWLEHFMSDFNRRFSRPAKYPKDLHRPVTQSPPELNDIFAWQELRTLSKALTFQYDKIMYIVDPTEENTRIAGEKLPFLITLTAALLSVTGTGRWIIRFSIHWPALIRVRLSTTNGWAPF